MSSASQQQSEADCPVALLLLNLNFHQNFNSEFLKCVLTALKMDFRVSQTEKDKYPIISLVCGILQKMIQMNLFTKQK